MIHEEKVRYMTQAACFEEKQRRKSSGHYAVLQEGLYFFSYDFDMAVCDRSVFDRSFYVVVLSGRQYIIHGIDEFYEFGFDWNYSDWNLSDSYDYLCICGILVLQ